MRKAFLEGLRPTLHISHRGGAALAPENTLVAFRQAVTRFRTDMLELDVRLTRDGELVVFHDETVERCTDGAGRVADLTLVELRALDAGFRFSPDGKTHPFRGSGVAISTLSEVLDALPAVRLNIELKPGHPDAQLVLADVLRLKKALPRACVGSESDDVSGLVFEALPDACHFYPRDALSAFVIAAFSGEAPPDDDRYSVLDMPLVWEGQRLFTPALREAADRMGRWINVWTVDSVDEMTRLVQEGVGGIMTDRPDRLRAALDAEARDGP